MSVGRDIRRRVLFLCQAALLGTIVWTPLLARDDVELANDDFLYVFDLGSPSEGSKLRFFIQKFFQSERDRGVDADVVNHREAAVLQHVASARIIAIDSIRERNGSGVFEFTNSSSPKVVLIPPREGPDGRDEDRIKISLKVHGPLVLQKDGTKTFAVGFTVDHAFFGISSSKEVKLQPGKGGYHPVELER